MREDIITIVYILVSSILFVFMINEFIGLDSRVRILEIGIESVSK